MSFASRLLVHVTPRRVGEDLFATAVSFRPIQQFLNGPRDSFVGRFSFDSSFPFRN